MFLTEAHNLSKPMTYLSLGLRLLLALCYLMLAWKSLSGDAKMVADYARWGYPDWFRMAVAVAQIVGAGLLCWAPLSCYGAILLGGLMVGAIATHVRHDPPAAAISAVVILVLCLSVAWLMRPPFIKGG